MPRTTNNTNTNTNRLHQQTMAGNILCCGCLGGDDDDDDDDNDYGDAMLRSAYGLGGDDGDSEIPGRQVELRLFPRYNRHGEFEDDPRRIHLCRYLVPWCIARCLAQLGCDCGALAFSVGKKRALTMHS